MDGTRKVNPTRGLEHLKVQNALYDRRGKLTSTEREISFEAVDAAAFLLRELAAVFKRELEFDTRSGEVIFTEGDQQVARLSPVEALDMVESVCQELGPLLNRRV